MAIDDEINKNLQKIKLAMDKPFCVPHNIVAIDDMVQARIQEEMQTWQQSLYSDNEETIGDTIRRNADTNSKQLQELQAQNEMLKAEAADLRKMLKAEAADLRKEREENKKAAKKARRLNIAAFVLSIVLPVVSIVASILIAKFM